jgi:hypothetical protein
MKMRIYRKTEAGPHLVDEISAKGVTSDGKILDNVISAFSEWLCQETGEGCYHFDCGIRSIRSCGDYWSNFRLVDGVAFDRYHQHGREAHIVSKEGEPGEVTFTWEGDPIPFKGEDTVFGVDVYDPGYVLATSATVTNFLGSQKPAYFSKITSKNFKQSSRAYAKVFKDEKALLKYLQEKEEIFGYMASHYGYSFTPEIKSCLWEHNPKADIMAEIDKVLARINGSEPVNQPVLIASDPLSEAINRMKEMQLYEPVVNDFISDGKLYMSEAGGIIYDLNDDAKEAVERTRQFGNPYHVVRTNTVIGEMYAVLYVSNYEDEWEYEHRDLRSGEIIANVYNTSLGIDEIGPICVNCANGGLVRTA